MFGNRKPFALLLILLSALFLISVSTALFPQLSFPLTTEELLEAGGSPPVPTPWSKHAATREPGGLDPRVE